MLSLTPMPTFRAVCAWAIFAIALGFAKPLRAQTNDLPRLVFNLQRSEDFRVRTQAALALGVTRNAGAVEPLCGALRDPNNTVRAAAAAAMGRLSLGGTDCVRARLSQEPSDVVRSAMETALLLIATGGVSEPQFVASTRFYIAFGKTADKTGRKGSDIDILVRGAMAQKSRKVAGFLVAPVTESLADAQRRTSAHSSVKPFFLSPSVGKPDYSGGNLTVRIEVAMLSYPQQNLIGSFSVKLTEPGVSSPSPGSEDELIKLAAERAVDKFATAAPGLE